MSDIQRRPDEDLKKVVVAELARLGTVDSTRVGVSVEDGAVTLSGEVETYPEKLLAEQAALGVPGVTAVAEGITVRSPFGGTNDTDVARRAGEALRRADDVLGGHVSASVHDGTVTLTGHLASEDRRDAAGRAVSELKGVRAVNNEITVDPAPAPE